MRIQVSEDGDTVCIALRGVAGRHHRILQALTQCPFGLGLPASTPGDPGPGLRVAPAPTAGVSIRAAADEMHIRIATRTRVRGAPRLEALSLYYYLRHVLIEGGAERALAARQPVTGD